MANQPPFLDLPFCYDGAAFNPSSPLVLTPEAQSYLQGLQTQIASASTQARTPISLTNQSASIGTTEILPLATGIYRVSYSARITQAGGATSSIEVQILSTQGTVTITLPQPSVALTTNTTGTVLQGSVLVIADSQTPISYAVIYGSTGVPVMKFALYFTIESLSA